MIHRVVASAFLLRERHMMTVTVKDFDNWTAEDESQALHDLRDGAQVNKHIIKGGVYYALLNDKTVIPISLQISAKDAQSLGEGDTDETKGLKAIQRLAHKAGYQHDLEDLTVQQLGALLTDYVSVLNRTVGDLGKSSASASSSKANTGTH